MDKVESKPVFKYQKDMDVHASTDCPPPEAKSQKRKAFRFVKSPITNTDFVTYVGLGNKLSRQTDPIHKQKRCMACGLSMFKTLDNAITNYTNNPKRSTVTYTHIAEGELLPTDGVFDENG
jgi:hypothetical protein